jgi:hypothetical protein
MFYINIFSREIRGRGIRRGRGRGHSDAPGPSQSYIDPPPPAHTSVSPGISICIRFLLHDATAYMWISSFLVLQVSKMTIT